MCGDDDWSVIILIVSVQLILKLAPLALSEKAKKEWLTLFILLTIELDVPLCCIFLK